MSKRKGTLQRGRRWRADEASRVLAQWRRSGMSAAAFSRARGLSPMRLSYWSRRLANGLAERKPSTDGCSPGDGRAV